MVFCHRLRLLIPPCRFNMNIICWQSVGYPGIYLWPDLQVRYFALQGDVCDWGFWISLLKSWDETDWGPAQSFPWAAPWNSRSCPPRKTVGFKKDHWKDSKPSRWGRAAGLCSTYNCCSASHLHTDFIFVVGVWQTPLTAVIQEAGETQWQLSQTAGEGPWGCCRQEWLTGQVASGGLFSGNSVQSYCPWHLLLGWAN